MTRARHPEGSASSSLASRTAALRALLESNFPDQLVFRTEEAQEDEVVFAMDVDVFAKGDVDETVPLVGASLIDDGEVQVGIGGTYFTFSPTRGQPSAEYGASQLIEAFLRNGATVSVKASHHRRRVRVTVTGSKSQGYDSTMVYRGTFNAEDRSFQLPPAFPA